MSTATRTSPFYAINHADAHLRLQHLRRRRAELARAGAASPSAWRSRPRSLAARVEVTAFSLLARRLEGVPR